MNQWSASDIPSQSGRTAIVTGGNSGIGYFTALELARHGADVVLACRSVAKGKDAAARIRAAVPQARVTCQALDLASQAAIHTFAQDWIASTRRLDLLINNAGVMALPRRATTADGFEMQFGTNVLGHFTLTGLLLPAMLPASLGTGLEAAASPSRPPRIVMLASIAHLQGHIDLDNLQSEKKYSPMTAYQQSKLADLMLSFELDHRLKECGMAVESIAAHPGVAQTELFIRDAPAWQRPMRLVTGALIKLLLNSAEQGALPTLYAATAQDAKSGCYYGPQGFKEMRGPVGDAKISDRAQNRTVAAALWDKCEQLTGVRFP